MRGWVLDASALLALLNNEPGNEQVARVVTEGAVMSSVNLSEVVTKFSLPVLTADRAWENVLSDVKVHVIR